jgi:hypothetical protein
MIPPPAQHLMSKRAGATVVESKGNNAVYVSKPDVVASIIKSAARLSEGIRTAAAGGARAH